MFFRLYFIALLTLGPCLGQAVPAAQPPDDALLDPAYPDMLRWALAGVQLPPAPNDPRPIIRLQPGDDLAAAIAEPNRIVMLAAGVYPIVSTLALADHVVLRGSSPFQTKLILKLRGIRPTATDQPFLPWTTGLLLENITASGIENLTVQFEDSLPPPPDPKLLARGYVDDPDGQKDLHVVAVRFSGSRQCWLTNVAIHNSGQHPLILESSSHITVADVEIKGAYNKGVDSGELLINGSEDCLLSGLTVADIRHVSFGRDARGQPSCGNVLINSRLAVDVRLRHPRVASNLIQECVIAVPEWHDFPPITLGWNPTHAVDADKTNLVYFCTITRDFLSAGTRFSIADNPNQVYHIFANSSRRGNVEVLGPAPKFSTLRPVR